MVSYDASYRDALRELGILQALLKAVLQRYACSRCRGPVSSGMLRWDSEPDMRLDPLVVDTLQGTPCIASCAFHSTMYGVRNGTVCVCENADFGGSGSVVPR